MQRYIQVWPYKIRTTLFMMMMIKRKQSALHGNTANMQGEDEPQKTKADTSRQHGRAPCLKTTLTLYNLHDFRAACDVLQVMNRSPTIAAYATNAEVQSASTSHTRDRQMDHRGRPISIEVRAKFGNAMGNVCLPIRRSPSTSLKS